VVLTHDAVSASARATSARLAVDPAADRWLACLPLAHVGGLAIVARAVVKGTPPPVVPPNAVTTYGLTETGSGVVYDGVPLDGVEVRIDDGEVHLRAPMLLRAYRDGRDPKTADGWFATGDMGGWQDGRLVVHGRRGDMIVSGGENVWPEPVERVLASHPAVADVAVAGRADPEWGQRVVAFVVAAEPATPPSLDGLREHVKQQLPAWCAPRQLVLVPALPRTALGKVRRGDLPSAR
jgi:O-succinylbenzoic acid--CoA ligase